MSVGNLKDSGNQGNNFPYQLKSLQGLQSIYDVLFAIAKENLSPSVRTPNILRVDTAGSIPKSYSFSIANVGNATGTVSGTNLLPGEVINFDAGVLNNGFGTVNYDATGTTFLITYVS